MNQSEKYISFLCDMTFLSLWSFPSPIGKKGKELCDVLIIFENYIIIISVKSIEEKKSDDYKVDVSRWLKSVFTKSNSQLLGAERFLQSEDEVIINELGEKVKLPPMEDREYFKITIALGRGEKMPLFFGDSGKGFIHVFDEISVKTIFSELNTITDFIKFIKEKETFLKGKEVQFTGEEDLLALYLMNGNEFPSDEAKIVIDSGFWEDYQKSNQYKEQKAGNKISYIWDSIIENFSKNFYDDTLVKSMSREDFELSLRCLAKEDRFHRIEFAKAFLDLVSGFSEKKANSRIVKASDNNNVSYVFLISSKSTSREHRYYELANRCFIARSKFVDCKTIIGIATEESIMKTGFSLELVYLHIPDWTEQQAKEAEEMIEDLRFFKNI